MGDKGNEGGVPEIRARSRLTTHLRARRLARSRAGCGKTRKTYALRNDLIDYVSA
jgi:hypothetical protein